MVEIATNRDWAEQARTELNRLWNTSFDLWINDGAWRCAMGGDPPSVQTESAEDPLELLDVLQSVAESGRPGRLRRADGRDVAVLPVPNDDAVPAAATALIDPDSLFELLGSTSTRVLDQQVELNQYQTHLESYVEQVTVDLEELTWLRALAGNIQLRDGYNQAENAAGSILPTLCDLIDAEAVMLIPCRTESSGDQPDIGYPCFEAGPLKADHRTCRQIVEVCRSRAENRPCVENHLNRIPEFADVDAVESCILVTVAASDYQFGWLLALNRRSIVTSGETTRSGSPSPVERRSASEIEFGTFEASLMSAAASTLATYARNSNLFREKEQLLTGVIRSLINAIDAKDSYTCGHSDRVALVARSLAEQLGLDQRECDQLYMAGLLHDIGKIGVPDNVLNKPGRLTDLEFELIKQHPVIGYDILKHLDKFSYVLPGVLHHHEAWDGSGYPHGIRGEEIPLSARILAVADAYDAMTSDRPYRKGMAPERAESILREGAGRQWDAQVVDAFFARLRGSNRVCTVVETLEQQSRQMMAMTE